LFSEVVREERSIVLLENRNLRKDGREIVLETSGRPFFDDHGNLLGYRGIDRDVTARNLANEELRKLSRAVAQSANAVLITDPSGVIEYVNPKFCELTGYAAGEVIGKTPRVLKSGETSPATYQAMWAALLAGKEWYGEFHNRKKSGELFWCLESISPLRNDKGKITHFVSVKEDISSRKLAESTIRQLAYYDSLTGLPNRRLFRDRLEQAAEAAQRTGAAVAVCHIDIDRLKNVNDVFGHAAGDAVIREAAQRIGGALRRGDTLSRMEGDEFAVILSEVRKTEEAARIVEQIVAVGRFTFTAGEQSVFVTCSAGLSLYPTDTHELDILNRNAGTALHRAKAAGDSYQFFTVDMNVRTLQRVTLENSLRNALRDGQFAIALQAQIDIATGRLSGAEVLLRCNHPELEGVSPATFIPLAEETGLILPIGEWVLRQACAIIARWRHDGLSLVPLSVNISARQFRDPRFIDLLTGILREAGVAHDSLELELTESVIMEHTGEAIERLRLLASCGLRIAIDDFGTGYSSLSYLKRMPISVLKIDQSFIHDLAEDREDLAIVSAIVAVARSLNLRTVAEGVETTGQLELLRAMGCNSMQGFLHSRPMAEAGFTAMLRLLDKEQSAVLAAAGTAR
jgi:diguanylate cyclase (GGDEF)-like protein/PAS domain S-box-containing protein